MSEHSPYKTEMSAIQKKVIAWAPATVANLNVGFDALGLALESPQERMIIEESLSCGVQLSDQYAVDQQGHRKEIDLPWEIERNVAGKAALSTLKMLESFQYIPTDSGLKLTVEKSIMPGSGIGSSASSAVAAAVGVNTLFGSRLSRDEVLCCALDGEELASGARHRDNVAPALFGGLCLNTPDGRILELPPPSWTLVILHPQIELKTSESRAVLPPQVPLSVTSRAAAWMGSFVSACYAKDALNAALSLQDLYVGPARLPLIPGLERCTEAALAAGAISGGISGSGPSSFWICLNQSQARQVEAVLLAEMKELNIPTWSYVSGINQRGAYALLQPQ